MAQNINPLFNIPILETKDPNAIEAAQNLALQELLAYVKNNSTFYQNHFKKNQVDFDSIKTIKDLQNIPAISKDDLQNFNDDFICVPKEEIVDFVTTSGTTGTPVTFALSNKDLDRLAYNEAISLVCADGKPNDIYQLTTTIDRRFMAGLAYFLGIRNLECSIIRVGSGIPQLQIDTIERIQPNILIAVPSFILSLIRYAKTIGYDLQNSSVKKIICIGESIRDENFQPNALHQKISQAWDVELFSTYASTEMSTAYTECTAKNGGHEHPELIISELLDDNDQVITEEDTYGELCITTLGVEGMPLIRFKTGDIVKFQQTACSCGRQTKRISPVMGRKNQMIKYKGTTLYPPAIFEVLNNFKAINNYVIELKHNDINTDEVIVYISAKTNEANSLLEQLAEMLRAKLRVKPRIFMISDKELHAMQNKTGARKPLKFIDSRN